MPPVRVSWLSFSIVLAGCVEGSPPETLETDGGTDAGTDTGIEAGTDGLPDLVDPNLQECEHCDDGNACTVGLCHPETGQCFFQPRVCDDGLGCTQDSCDPESGCVFDPVDSACAAGQGCVTEVACSLDAPAPMADGTWAAVPSTPGCWHFLNDTWCADDDGCACNGAEICDPWHATLPGGCVPAPRPEWPCEDDGNACTEENCCEPWNPDGCRLHAELQAATPEGQAPALEQFCINAGEKEAVDGPAGPVECVTGELKYRVNVPDAILDDFAPDKDEGYWCNDCRPCTVNDCDEATGTCDDRYRSNGPFYGDEPPKMIDAFGEGCPEDQRACFGDANFGCGQFSCDSGVCAAPAHPDNEDSSVSELCHGFPVREVSTEDADDVVPAETCFEVGCVDVTTSEGGETVPWFECVAMPHDELCASNDVCSEAACDGADICPGGCTPAQLGNILVGNSTSRRETPPMAGTVILGCSAGDPAVACDDGIECTVDTCDPVEGCVHGPDDRMCPNLGGAKWQPCDYDSYCSEDAGCLVQGDDPCAEIGDELECALECIEGEDARTCMGYEACGPGTCFTEGFSTLDLESIVDQCPWGLGLLPNPGDADFDGNGPLVNIDVTLSISPDQHSIYAWIDFEARETKSDFSTLQVPLPPVVVATTGVTCVDILSERTGAARGLATSDLGGFVDFTSVTGVIDGASVRGDTLGGDISDDSNCHDDTWIEKIDLGSVEVSFRQDCALE